MAANVGRMIDAVTGCLAAFAGRYGRDVIKRMIGGDADRNADAGVEGRLLRRLSADDVANREAIKAAVADLGRHPDDERLQAAVREQVEKALATNAGLRSDLAELLKAAGGGAVAWGDRSVAAQTITGPVATGDNARVTQVQLPPGGVPSPDEVPARRVWNVSRRPSRVFVGRQADLDHLARLLDHRGGGVVGQSVAGLGGVGKTEVALHHVHAHRDRYSLVWWITADSPDKVTAGLASLARRLVPTLAVLTDEQAAQWAVAWLQQRDGWLLVLDNVEDPAHVVDLVGSLEGGRVLVTTRRDVDWVGYGLGVLRLGVLALEDAVRLLVERTGQDDRVAAEGIAVELGCLPLALEQASAYVIHHRLSLVDYYVRLREQPAAVYAGVAPGQDAERAVARVWDVTLAALEAADPRLCVCWRCWRGGRRMACLVIWSPACWGVTGLPLTGRWGCWRRTTWSPWRRGRSVSTGWFRPCCAIAGMVPGC